MLSNAADVMLEYEAIRIELSQHYSQFPNSLIKHFSAYISFNSKKPKTTIQANSYHFTDITYASGCLHCLTMVDDCVKLLMSSYELLSLYFQFLLKQ